MKTFSNYIPCKKNTESLLILYTELFFLDTERYKSNRYKSGNLYDHWILLDFCDLLILNFSYVVTKNILIPYRTKKEYHSSSVRCAGKKYSKKLSNTIMRFSIIYSSKIVFENSFLLVWIFICLYVDIIYIKYFILFSEHGFVNNLLYMYIIRK